MKRRIFQTVFFYKFDKKTPAFQISPTKKLTGQNESGQRALFVNSWSGAGLVILRHDILLQLAAKVDTSL
jgi:hypothetical protein